jgi:hypothetical protein
MVWNLKTNTIRIDQNPEPKDANAKICMQLPEDANVEMKKRFPLNGYPGFIRVGE